MPRLIAVEEPDPEYADLFNNTITEIGGSVAARFARLQSRTDGGERRNANTDATAWRRAIRNAARRAIRNAASQAAPRPPNSRRPRPRAFPWPRADKAFRFAAAEAVDYLVQHFPQQVREEGPDEFYYRRWYEIISGIMNDEYWEEATLNQAMIRQWTATNTPSSVQPPAPYYSGHRRRSRAEYDTLARSYHVMSATPWSQTPIAGFRGEVIQDYWHDVWHAVHETDWTLPRRWMTQDNPPIIARVTALWQVRADRRPAKTILSTYSRSVLYEEHNHQLSDIIPINTANRRYNWTVKLPPFTETPYELERSRDFMLDIHTRVIARHSEEGEAQRLRLSMAPGAAMGRYYGAASHITTQWQPAITVWMAKNRDPNGPQPPRIEQGLWSPILCYKKPIPSHRQDSTVARYALRRHGYEPDISGQPTRPEVMPRSGGSGASIVYGNHGSPETTDMPYMDGRWDWPWPTNAIHVVDVPPLGWGWYVPPRPPFPWTTYWREANGRWDAMPGRISQEQFDNIWHPPWQQD